MKSPHLPLLLAWLCLTLSTTLSAFDQESLPQLLDIELANEDGTPKEWSIEPLQDNQHVFVDTDIAYTGNSSFCIRSECEDPEKPVITFLTFPRTFAGKILVVSFKYKFTSESKQTMAHLYGGGLKKDLEENTRTFSPVIIKDDTSDWKEAKYYFLLNPNVANIRLVICLYGKGSIHVDDIQLGVPSEEGIIPINEAPAWTPKEWLADKDTELNEASGVHLGELNDFQWQGLEALGQLWAFLKYRHPALTTGQFNWDAELFRILPSIADASSFEERNQLFEDWIELLDTRIPDTYNKAVDTQTSARHP